MKQAFVIILLVLCNASVQAQTFEAASSVHDRPPKKIQADYNKQVTAVQLKPIKIFASDASSSVMVTCNSRSTYVENKPVVVKPAIQDNSSSVHAHNNLSTELQKAPEKKEKYFSPNTMNQAKGSAHSNKSNLSESSSVNDVTPPGSKKNPGRNKIQM